MVQRPTAPDAWIVRSLTLMSALERDLDRVSLNLYAELLGLAGQNRNVDAGNLPPDTLYDVI